MFWIIRRLFWLAVIVVLVYYGANYKIDDKPIKEYAIEFYRTPLVQSAIRSAKKMVGEFVDDQLNSETPEEPLEIKKDDESAEEISVEERKALEQVIEKERS